MSCGPIAMRWRSSATPCGSSASSGTTRGSSSYQVSVSAVVSQATSVPSGETASSGQVEKRRAVAGDRGLERLHRQLGCQCPWPFGRRLRRREADELAVAPHDRRPVGQQGVHRLVAEPKRWTDPSGSSSISSLGASADSGTNDNTAPPSQRGATCVGCSACAARRSSIAARRTALSPLRWSERRPGRSMPSQ